MKKIWLLILPLLITACKKDKDPLPQTMTRDTLIVSQDSATQLSDSAAVATPLKLETFAFPSQVAGCSCYFAENKDQFLKGQYIFIDDYGNNAYIKVEGQPVEIKMEEGDFDPDNFDRVIENDDYRVSMKGTRIKSEKEVMMYTGKMTVENKVTKQKITTTIYGECGC